MSYAVRNDGVYGWRSIASRGELFENEDFSEVEPPPAAPVLPTDEELAAAAKIKRDQLLAVAANRMGPLQDAADQGQATDDETASLALWKGYRIKLNRIEQQEGFPADIQWPLSPDDLPEPEPEPEPVETPDDVPAE